MPMCVLPLVRRLWLCTLEEVDRGTVLVKRDDRLLPARQAAHAKAIPSLLAPVVLRANLVDMDVEQLLDRRLDLQLARPRIDAERVGVAVLRLVRTLLGDDRRQNHLMRFQP